MLGLVTTLLSTAVLSAISFAVFLPVLFQNNLGRNLPGEKRLPEALDSMYQKVKIVRNGEEQRTLSTMLVCAIMIGLSGVILSMWLLVSMLGVDIYRIFSLCFWILLAVTGLLTTLNDLRRRIPQKYRKYRQSGVVITLQFAAALTFGTAWYWQPSFLTYNIYAIITLWGFLIFIPSVSLRTIVICGGMFALFDLSAVTSGLMEAPLQLEKLQFLPPLLIVSPKAMFGLQTGMGLGFGDLIASAIIIRTAAKYGLHWWVFASYVIALFITVNIGQTYQVSLPALVTLMPIMISTFLLAAAKTRQLKLAW